MNYKLRISLLSGLTGLMLVCGGCNQEGAAVTEISDSVSEPVQEQEVVVDIVGDIMLSRGVEVFLEKEGYDYPYEEVKELFWEDDLTIGNLECPITDSGNSANKAKRFVFQADYENAAALKRAGFDCMNLANNHSMDYLDVGLGDTLDALWENGLATVGAGKNASENMTYLFEKEGMTIGILAFSAFPSEGFFYNEEKPTVNYLSTYNMEQVAEKIQALTCDFKIVYFHWGVEFEPYNSETQQQFAHMAVDAGANLVVGSHPHVLQNSEIYKDIPIYYSLGNFVFDRQIPPGTDRTMILRVRIHRDGQAELEEIPGSIQKSKVCLDLNSAPEGTI